MFLGDLTSSEQQSIRRELRIAQVVLAEHFGAVSSDFTAYVSTDLDALNEHYASHVGQGTVTALTCGGTAREGAIFLILETCHEKHRRSGGPLAHEYFHVLQYEAGLVVTADRKLWWLVEGSAEYASGLVGEAQGRRTLDTLRQGKELSWSAGLAEGARYWYDYGFLATDRLLQRASPEAILEFFRLGGDETAFESVFGMPWLVFWSSTDAYLRVAVRPFEWRVGGTVLGADGLPMEGVAVYALVRIGGEAWNAGGGGTGPEGAFEFTAPGSGYTLGFWMQCPRDDDIGGRWVYMGEWGEAQRRCRPRRNPEPRRQTGEAVRRRGAGPNRPRDRDSRDAGVTHREALRGVRATPRWRACGRLRGSPRGSTAGW